MSSVAQKIKTVNSKHWTSVLQHANKSKTESCTFVKHLIAISVSNILYLRKILLIDDFDARVFEGMTLRYLKSKPPCSSGAETIGRWLNGAFEAVDRKYLRHLMLEIKDSDVEKTLELYVMSFDYDEGKESVGFSIKSNGKSNSLSNKTKFSWNDIQSRTIELIQMCITVTKTCASLPNSFMISMRLSYNDNAPFGYLPNGYKPCEAMAFEFAEPPRKIELGVVQTNFHSFRLITKTCLNNQNLEAIQEDDQEMEDVQENNPVQEEIPRAVNIFGIDNSSPKKNLEEICKDPLKKNTAPANIEIPVDVDSGSETEISISAQELVAKAKNIHLDDVTVSQESCISTMPFPEEGIIIPETNNSPSAFDLLMSSQENVPLSNIAQKMRCPCGSDERTSTIFKCLHCGFWSHAECYGILEISEIGEFQFICVKCHGIDENTKCHDNIMLDLKAPSHQKLAAFRRVLSFCRNPKVKIITLPKVEKLLGLENIQKLFDIIMKKFVNCEMAVATPRKNNYAINKEKLLEEVQKYFYSLFENSQATQMSSSMLMSQPPKAMKRKQISDDEPLTKKFKAVMSPYKKFDRNIEN